MPKATVKIYDENNNLVSEQPYGKNGITGTVVDGQRQKVYQDTDEQGNKVYLAAEGFKDPFIRAGKEIENNISIQAPKVKIVDNKVTVQATKDVLASPLVAQMKQELQSLKGADLNSPETQKAIEALNEEVSNNITNAMFQMSMGWTKDQYNDYQYTQQSVSGTNPMRSSNKVKGKDKDGKIIMKTPQEWIDYYREVYNTDERTDAYKKSFMSRDPYERTMALVMGQGKEIPVYGFDAAERMGEGWKAFVNQMGKFPEGTLRLIGEDNVTRRVEGLVKNKNIPVESMRKFNVSSEEQFNAKKDSLKGKSWSELSDDDKAFLVLLGASREGELEREADTSEAMSKYRGKKTNTFAWETNKQDYERAERKAAREIGAEDLNSAVSDDDDTSREAISRILANNSFDKYKTTRNNYDTWQGYQDWTEEGEKELANTALWSQAAQNVGNFAGVIGRFLWENAVVKGATGGLSMNAISDKIGAGVVNSLARHGISPASSFGKNSLQFTASLVGTIPEDILQTSVDNVLTYNIDENTNLFNPEEMSENFKNNLIFMSLFNAGKAGFNAIRRARIAKQIAKQADLGKAINIEGLNSDVDDVVRATKKGDQVKVTDETVSVVDDAGKEKVLKNITPEQGKMVQQSLFDYAETPKTPDSGNVLDDAAKAVDEQPTVKVEVDTPNGRVLADAPDFRIRNVGDGLKMKIDPTPPNVKAIQTQTLGAAMRDFSQVHLPEFQRRFPGVEVSDFDWVFHNTRNGLQPNQIVGMINPETGREVTEQMIEAMKWFGDQPFMKDLRKASRESLGLEGDFNMLGYLPHSTYDPSNLSFDEALTGQLWRQYTGASMTGEHGEYRGFGGDFNSRYRTFASNMLWDARAKDVAAAKLMEEAAMDGKNITSEQAVKAVEGQKNIQKKVDDAGSTKELENALSSDTDDVDFKKIDEATKKQAETSGLGKAIHDNYAEVFFGANSATVAKQSGGARQAFDTLGNTMRNTQIIDRHGRRMSWYDWGGADFVYAERNAIEMVNRYMREGGDLREMLVEFVRSHSKRSLEYSEAVADKWMKKLGDIPGQITKADAIRSLGGSMKWEAMNRMRKFLTMAKYDEFNDATKKAIDRFLFGHMQTDTIKNSRKIAQKLGNALGELTSMRYRALFYGNIKNALLQTTELNRLFTTFKWGDVATMTRKMATDSTFRARVDDYYDAIAPRKSSFRADMYNDYAEVAGNLKTTEKGTTLKEKGKKVVDAVDNIGLAPIETAEAFKNRMMVAALVQEADTMGLHGDEALRHIRGRFERVALAMDEMGRIGLASNPVSRMALFLQNFQIRELGMHMYNISDEWAKGAKIPKKVLKASKYLIKVLGSKLATALIMARLGYSASQTLGVDPFGVLENYTGLDEEDMEGFDYFMKSPLFAGGMTSLLSDAYFMARKAYEESNPKTVSEEAEERLDDKSSWGLNFSFDQLMDMGQSFVPGNLFANRFGQMTEMLDSGWATSVSGNKMYTAPDDALNTILGYLFGRSATQNAQQYSQTYGDNILQTLGRFNPFRQYSEFDPIDTQNYSDWFKGDDNDLQQFSKGLRYFRSERDRIIDEYEDAIRRGYSDDEDAEAKNNMNQRLEELYGKLERFVDAYENKNGTIDANMTKQIVNVLNTGRKVLGDTEQEAEARSLQSYNDALERYSQHGFSPVGTYTGPTSRDESKEVKYQGSPQYRTAVSGRYTLSSEAVAVLKEADRVLADTRKELKQAVSAAYDSKDYDELRRIQNQYLESFDSVVAPIIAAYGSSVLTSTDVVNQLKDMLSTGTNSRSGDLIPSDHYRKDKYGRYRSMPLETVDVKKWAQQRFSDDIYNNPSVRSYSTAGDDIMEIRRLVAQGKPSRARARALQLKVRVDNQKRSLSQSDYNWLLDFLNNGEK